MAPVRFRKVLIIGLDGFDPNLVDSMLPRGALPKLAQLAETGGYSRLATTYPAQTPVAWSTFAVGTNPGGHGIFDFLGRDPGTYRPELALSRYEQKNAFLPPQVVNRRRGLPVWEQLTRAGVPSTVLRCPCTYPPGDDLDGRMLAGVGVPDLRGGLGTSTFYTAREDVHAKNSERVVRLPAPGNGVVRTNIIGPRDPRSREDLNFPIELHMEPGSQSIRLVSDGEPREMVLEVGRWSRWLKIRFKIGMLQSVYGMVRFRLLQGSPSPELYASPVNFDPVSPLFPISQPGRYAKELEDLVGPYYTTGMVEDHDGLINGRIDEAAFLEQCEEVMAQRRAMMFSELDRFDRGLFFCLFDTPDRLQHMFWHTREPDHPVNGVSDSDEHRDAIENHYRDCDRLIGEVMDRADDETLLIVLSDHGMGSFQRGLNLNTWLHDNGFLELKSGVKPGPDAGDMLRSVDWPRTKAYALGLGGIYLNLSGREAQGWLTAEDVEPVKDAISRGLTGLQDPQRGAVAVRSVLTREELYSGPHVDEAPDLLVNFASGYRVSWDTPLGGIPGALFEDNMKKWSGDHVADPKTVPGVLFMNQAFDETSPGLVDLAPTALTSLGVPPTKQMEGRVLL